MTETEKNKMNELIECVTKLTENVNKMVALQVVMITAISKLLQEEYEC